MATAKSIVKQLAQLGITATVAGVNDLVSNVRASPRGWVVPFAGRAVYGCLANQDASNATLETHQGKTSVKVASRRNHVWQVFTVKQTREDIERQLDDLLEGAS